MTTQCLPGRAPLAAGSGRGCGAGSPRGLRAKPTRGPRRSRRGAAVAKDTRTSPSPGAPARPALGKRRAGARLPGAERAAKRGFHGAGSALRSGSLLWTRARQGWARQLGGEQLEASQKAAFYLPSKGMAKQGPA